MKRLQERGYESELDLEQLLEGFRCFWRDAGRGDVPAHLWEELERVALVLDRRLVEVSDNHSSHDRPEDDYAACVYFYDGGFKGEIWAGSMNVGELDCPEPMPEDFEGFNAIPECEWWDSWSVK